MMAILNLIGIKGGLAIGATCLCGVFFFLNKEARADLRQTEAELAVAEQSIETLELQLELVEQAALERLADHEDLSNEEKELTDALEIEDPVDRRHAFVCAILRQQAAASGNADIPAGCGTDNAGGTGAVE